MQQVPIKIQPDVAMGVIYAYGDLLIHDDTGETVMTTTVTVIDGETFYNLQSQDKWLFGKYVEYQVSEKELIDNFSHYTRPSRTELDPTKNYSYLQDSQ